MPITPNSLAYGNFVGAKNVQFKPIASVLERKIVIIGTYDPAKTLTADNVPKQVFSPEDVGDQFGFGFMLHRLAVQAFLGSQGIETWVIPQPEDGAAVQADATATFSTTGTIAGTVYMYINGQSVPFGIATDDTSDNIADKAVAAADLIKELPTAQVVDGSTTDQVNITSKSGGTWGNYISVTFNEKAGEEFPIGVSVVVVDMSSGAGTIPDIDDALDALGTGDNQNEDYFTDLIYGYGQDSTTMDKLSAYNGSGNDFIGNYAKEVARPFRVLNGDVVADTAGLTALIIVGDGRKLDRTDGTIAVPGSPNHPEEIAALAMGIMANRNNIRAEESYKDIVLPGIIPGARDERWTADYDNRDLAVKAGISPTDVKNGAVVMQNVVTYYHPDNVPQENNGYRSQRNISILQNLLNATKLNFAQEKWLGITIVADVTKVSNVNSRLKARDTGSVTDALVGLTRSFEGNAWIFTASFTIDELASGNKVTIRAGGTGFDITLPVILSGEGGILNTTIEFDTSLAVLLG